MSRILNADFQELISFLETYTLKEQLLVSDFVIQLKTQHRKLYSVMVYVSELEFQKNNDFQEHSTGYIKEMLSDLLQSLFCWCNGAYKPALLLLRSAIETFTKAVVGNTDATIFVEKSMYNVFDKAKIHSWFSSPNGKKYYDLLHNNYVLLCQTVHSATTTNLEHVNSVGILPKFDIAKSNACYNLFISTIDNILGSLLLNSTRTYSQMYPLNRRVFLEGIQQRIKREVLLKLDC